MNERASPGIEGGGVGGVRPEAPVTVMERLKAVTAELHRAAEQHPFQRALVAGAIGRAGYAAHLRQMLVVHREVERALRALLAQRPELRAVVREEQFREGRLLEDLAFLGAPAGEGPLPPTARLCEVVREACAREPLAALGFHYVLEGSTNGSRFIARSVRRSLGFTTVHGTRSLDPYGDEQPAKWAAFKAAMNAAAFTPAEISVLESAACAMFRGITAISGDVPVAAPIAGTGPAAQGGARTQSGVVAPSAQRVIS